MSGSSVDYDVVIVGAGHNALVTSFYLAQSGLRVAVLEARDTVGGACKTEELFPGYRFSTCANILVWFRQKIFEDMDLGSRGVEVGGAELSTRVLPDGSGFTWWDDDQKLEAEIARFSKVDAQGWKDWKSLWSRASETLGPWLLSYPPSWDQLMTDEADPYGCLRELQGRCIAEVIDDHFETDVMRSGIVAPGDAGSLYEPGSALLMALNKAMDTYSETGIQPPRGYIKGGMGRITEAMSAAASDAGVSIFTGTPVQRVVAKGNSIAGVELADGSHIATTRVVLGCDPASSVHLLDSALDSNIAKRMESLQRRIAPLKLHCAMNGLPEWNAFPESDLPYRGPFALCRTREQSEEAWRAATAGELPLDPIKTIMTPSFWDRSVAPPGGHTLSVWTLFAPVSPRDGTWPARRDEMLELMLQSLEKDSPDFRDHLVNAMLLTPDDLESRVGLTDGNIHHIDMSPDQVLAGRPLPELANYRFPIAGLYGCGASHHPFGEVSGAPGHNAAHAVLEDLGKCDRSWQQIAA